MANTHHIEFTIDHTKVPSDQTDFIVFLDFSQLPSNHGFWSRISSGGGEIRCYNEVGTTEYAREIVDIDNVNYKGQVHCKVSGTLSSTADQVIRVEYGDTGLADYAVTATYGRNAVWSDFLAVWHLREDPSGTAPQFTDSTGNGHDGSSIGSMTSADVVTGKLGNAIEFDGSDDAIDIYTYNEPEGYDFALLESGDPPFTLSHWVYPKQESVDKDVFIKQGEWGSLVNDLTATDGKVAPRLQTWGSNNLGTISDSITVNAWNHYTGVFDPGIGYEAFVNGQSDGGFSSQTDTSTSEGGRVTIGASPDASPQWFLGVIDEVRVALFEQSAGWITTEYNNQSDPSTFYTVSAEQTIGGTTVTIADVGAGSDSVSDIAALMEILESGVGGDGVQDIGASIELDDAGQASDDLGIGAGLSVSDTGHGEDHQSQQVQLTVQDSGSGVDTLAVLKAVLIAIQDTGTGLDAVGNIDVIATVNESGVGADSLTIDATALITIADVGTGQDALTMIANALTVADIGQGVDTAIRYEESGDIAYITITMVQRSIQAEMNQRSIRASMHQRMIKPYMRTA